MKTLSVIIPAYNEKDTIEKIVSRVQAADSLGLEKEILIVDDGSTDGTRDIIKAIPNIRYFFHDKNQGKGGAVKTGFLNATGDIALIQDADLEYDPADYPELLKPIVEGYADVVYGSRFGSDKPHRVFNFHHYLANRLITFLSNICTNLNLADVEVGYKLFKKDAVKSMAEKLSSKRFGIEIELTSKIARRKYRIYEVNIAYRGRNVEEGKKIGWKDGVAALWHIAWYNLFD